MNSIPCSLSILTPIQAEILKRIAEGASRPQIAKERKVSVKTVEYHCMATMRKLGVYNVAVLTHWAIGVGLVPILYTATDNRPPTPTEEILLANLAKGRLAQRKPKQVVEAVEVVDNDDSYTEEIIRAPKDIVLTAEPKAPVPIFQPEPIVSEPIVPEQEQKVVEPIVVAPIVPERSPEVFTFTPGIIFEPQAAQPKPQPKRPVTQIKRDGVEMFNRIQISRDPAIEHPKCPTCGGCHNPKFVCRGPYVPELPKRIAMSTFKMTPAALKMIEG